MKQATPPYAYLPGHRPHPLANRGGRDQPSAIEKISPLDPDRWQDCTSYLDGFSLFNRGYYWEAHECWERVWIANERTGVAGELLKGLIQLAAAGLKVRQGLGERAAGLGTRAGAHFRAGQEASAAERFSGLAWAELTGFAAYVRSAGTTLQGSTEALVEVVFDRELSPTADDLSSAL